MRTGQEKLILVRKISQAVSVSAIVVIIWNTTFPLDRFVNPAFCFHIDPLVMVSTAMAERTFLQGLLPAFAVLAATALLGRFFCGWICPLGATLDFIALLKRPLSRKRRALEKNPSKLRFSKYAVLAVILVAALAGYQFAWTLDPIAVFMRMFSLAVQPAVNNGINALFEALLSRADLPAVEALYNALRESFVGTDIVSLANTRGIIALFSAIALLAFLRRRFWCRYLCPLGAMFALPALLSPLRRKASCGKNCRACMHTCRMNAIAADNTYRREECILCFDCVRDCPDDSTRFGFTAPGGGENRHTGRQAGGAAIHRQAFLRYSAASALSAAAAVVVEHAGAAAAPAKARYTLRPPGSLAGDEFIRRCIRCGNCMKICPTGVLIPSSLERGIDGLWSPVLDTAVSYCEYTCNLCGRVCPTGAIRNLAPGQKMKSVIGLAVINRDECVPYKKGIDCIVCEEHCPVPEKAIVTRMTRVKGKMVKAPVVIEKLCIGCGICQVKCPTEPKKSIIVVPQKNIAAKPS